MQRLAIIRDDNKVTVDGVPLTVDCSKLAADVHAVHWAEGHGEVEYRVTRCEHCGARSKKGNEIFTDVAAYLPYVREWERAKAVADVQRTAAERTANAPRQQG